MSAAVERSLAAPTLSPAAGKILESVATAKYTAVDACAVCTAVTGDLAVAAAADVWESCVACYRPRLPSRQRRRRLRTSSQDGQPLLVPFYLCIVRPSLALFQRGNQQLQLCAIADSSKGCLQ